MSIHVLATYRGGVIEPEHPLDLPEETRLEVMVVPVTAETNAETENRATPARPSAPKISPEELCARIARHAVGVGSLPHDFSRADIYRDHD